MAGGSKKTTIGYKYSLGVHAGIAHGPLDGIVEIQVDRRVAWTGVITDGTITVNAPLLFGGDKREGGVSGDVDIAMGLPTQTQNAYLVSQLGSDVPAFRGVACAILNQCYMGNNPYLKPWAFKAIRVYTTEDGAEQWYKGKALIVRPNSIPICAQYACDAFYDYVMASDSVLAYYPMGTNAQGVPDFDSTIGNIPEVKTTVEDLVSSPNPEGYFNYEVGVFGGDACAGSTSVRIDNDPVSSVAFSTQSPYGFETAFGDAALGNLGAYWSIIVLPRPGTGASTWLSGTVQFATENYSGSKLPPNFNVAIGLTMGLASGSPTNSRSLLITTALGSIPNSGNGNLFLEDAFDINGTEPVLLTMAFRIDPRTFEGAETNNEPAWQGRILARADKLDGTTISDFNDVWGVFGFSSSVDPEDLDDLTRILTPDTTPSASGFTKILQANWIHPYMADMILHDGSEMNQIATAFRRSWSGFVFNGAIDTLADDCLICGDMNPVHIIRESLTNTAWGMGYASGDIDSTSFEAAADTLVTEGMGISILWEREQTLEEFIGEILRHIDAVLYVSRSTGKFIIKLIREETPSVTLDESNIVEVTSSKRPTISELVNSVNIVYWDHTTDDDASLTVHNEALRQIQGVTISNTRQYPGFSNETIVQKVAARDLQSLSTPLLSCEIVTDRDGASINPGDAFTLNWPDLGISNTVMRANQVDYGNGIDNSVTISAVQDVFKTPSAVSTGTPSEEWIDPATILPVAAVARVITEVPYYELVVDQGQSRIDTILTDDADAGFLLVSAGRADNELNADILVDSGGGYTDSGTLSFHGWATLSADITQTTTTITISTSNDLETVETGTIAQINNEMVRVDALNQDGSGNYISITVGRGILDTAPRKHVTGDVISFWDEAAVSDDVQYADGETIDVKLTTVQGSNVLAQADAPVDSVTLDSRAIRPYPPGNFKVDSVLYPDNPIWFGDHTFTWAHRDRKQQTDGTFYDHTEGNIGPEAGTTYRVEGYSYAGSPEVETQFIDKTLASVTTWTYDAAEVAADPNVDDLPVDSERIIIRVFSVRSGYDCAYPAEIEIAPAALLNSGVTVDMTTAGETP